MSKTSPPSGGIAHPYLFTRAHARAREIAERHLETCGYRVLDRDLAPRAGAHGLVASSERLLLFCELRVHLSPGLARSYDGARRRLRLAAAAWLVERPGRALPPAMRFDVITVHLNRSGELVGLEHLPDAF